MTVTAGKIRILENSLLYQGWSTLRKYVILYTRKSGDTEKQIREIYDSGDGAAVLLFHPAAKKITLVRQFRLAALLNGHESGFLLEACAGMLDEHDAVSAIRKEILEETGYSVTDVKKVYTAFASPGAHQEKIHFFVASYSNESKTEAGGGQRKEQEEIEVEEYNYEDILPLIQSGAIQDAKTLILLQWALIHLPV